MTTIGWIVFRTAAVVSLALPSAVQAVIERVDYCGGQFTRTGGVPLQQGFTQTVTVRGNFVDTATRVEAPTGIVASIASRTGGGGLKSSLTLKITPLISMAPGNHTISLRYLVELSGPDRFAVSILPTPIVSSLSISPASGLLIGQRVTVTARGANASRARLKSKVAESFKSLQQSGSADTLTVAGIVREPTLNLTAASFFDGKAPGNVQRCTDAFGGGKLSVRAELPFPTPLMRNNYRLGPSESCAGKTYSRLAGSALQTCINTVGQPTATNPRVERLVTIPNLTWGVANQTKVSITWPFKIRLKDGNRVVEERTISSLGIGQEALFVRNRPESRRRWIRHDACPWCYDVNASPYDWSDPQAMQVLIGPPPPD
ncbi:MAG TPA: hypothetical protein VGC00_00730 [Thermoanaerobaculia bacterium]